MPAMVGCHYPLSVPSFGDLPYLTRLPHPASISPGGAIASLFLTEGATTWAFGRRPLPRALRSFFGAAKKMI